LFSVTDREMKKRSVSLGLSSAFIAAPSVCCWTSNFPALHLFERCFMSGAADGCRRRGQNFNAIGHICQHVTNPPAKKYCGGEGDLPSAVNK